MYHPQQYQREDKYILIALYQRQEYMMALFGKICIKIMGRLVSIPGAGKTKHIGRFNTEPEARMAIKKFKDSNF